MATAELGLGRARVGCLAPDEEAMAYGYLFAIGGAELVTTLVSAPLGIAFHALLLVVTLGHAAFLLETGPSLPQGSLLRWPRRGSGEDDASSGATGRSAFARLVLTLSLAPLTRVLSLAAPLGQFDQTYWYVIVGIPLSAGTLVVLRLGGFSAASIGWRLRPRLLPAHLLVASAGLGLGTVEWLVLRPEPLVASLSLEAVLLPALVLLLFTGLLEELMFRGLMQRAAEDAFGPGGLVYASALFALLHVGFASGLEVLLVFGIALIFALVVKRTGSLVGVTLSHGLLNTWLLVLAPNLLG